jgi:hypothetical protein
MEHINLSGRKRESYKVEFSHSILWECALGLAAVTNGAFIDTLEHTAKIAEIRAGASAELKKQVDRIEKNNTWKSLLQLLHFVDADSLEDFIAAVEELDWKELKRLCLPSLGHEKEEARKKAASGDAESLNELISHVEGHKFFPAYISFICQESPGELKKHLIAAMEGWYRAAIEPNQEELSSILEKDVHGKKLLASSLSPEELAEQATGGISYLPEPGVFTVRLIPQYVYRPWTIEADLEGAKVFYYPVSNSSLPADVPDIPDYFLLQKQKALSDEFRLRIVKLLFKGDLPLQDITEELKIGKSTVHHHLKILRAAKLAEVHNHQYRIKKEAVLSLGRELERYVKGGFE